MKSESEKFGKGKALAFAVLFAVLSFIIVSVGCVSAGSSFTQQNNNKSAFSASWTTETVDAEKYFTDFYPRAIAIDGFNRPHIAYGGDHLYHAYFDGLEWRYETVDNSPEVGRYVSIAIDSNNNVHISYRDWSNEDLKYATDASGSWVTSTIDSAGNVGWYTSIAIDSNNKVHISYYDWSNEELKYATDASGAWVTSTIDSKGEVGQYTSIAVDSNNKVHISYREDSKYGCYLKYATDASGVWVTSTIGSGGWRGTSIAIDSNNKVHISYHRRSTDSLKYATDVSGSWVTSTIDSKGDVGQYTSIAIDSNNNVHISYYDYSDKDLKYATDASGSWVTSTIDSAWSVGEDTSIAIDSNNNVHISYFDDSNENLKYATDASGSWVTYTIDSSRDVGRHNSIAVDSNNNVHISYFDDSNENLKYATDVSGSWVTSTIDSGLSVGKYTSIAIDSNNKVHISYYDWNSWSGYYDELKYATDASGSWVTSTIDDWYTGKYTSIAIDSNNNVHISYEGNNHLKYATDASGAWVSSTIDYGSLALNVDTSIAIDSNNRVHISYHDWINEDLKYATDVSGAWVKSTIDSVGDVGSDTSVAVDSNDKVHISYYDWSNRDLKYATGASGAWVKSTIDSVGDVGYDTSIAIDSNNKVHISYYDASNDSLKYATGASGAWVTSTIDSAGSVGWYTSIAIDSNDKVHISYYDSSNKDLKYATNRVSYPAPDISVSPVSFDFGNVNVGSTSAPRTFTISNTGDADLEIGTISITGTDASEFSIQNDNCSGQTIAPSGTCTVDVVFAPTSADTKSAYLTIPSNDPDENPVNIALSGTGASIFDTGPGTYPSIMGTHKGEIKPSQNINVSKLYTYPCVGTGGHTESIKLYENDELIASGTWDGYQSDWHNLTLHNVSGAPYVMLYEGHEYNYTIVTGSYPQIIHEPIKEVTGGTITCSSFVDANGKTYTDWIPAIRFE